MLETEKENCPNIVHDIMKNTMKIPNADEIKLVRAHRLGKSTKDKSKPRPIIVKFHYFGDRRVVWKGRKNFKESKSGITVAEDFPVEIEMNRKKLVPYLKSAKGDKNVDYAFLNVDKLIVSTKTGQKFAYTVNNLDTVPIIWRPSSVKN